MTLVYVNKAGELTDENDPSVAFQYDDTDPRVAHLVKPKKEEAPAKESAPKPQAARKK